MKTVKISLTFVGSLIHSIKYDVVFLLFTVHCNVFVYSV